MASHYLPSVSDLDETAQEESNEMEQTEHILARKSTRSFYQDSLDVVVKKYEEVSEWYVLVKNMARYVEYLFDTVVRGSRSWGRERQISHTGTP